MLHSTKKIDTNLYKPSDEQENYRYDSDLYFPTSIKDTINWFPFITIMEHTANITETKSGMIPSLLKVFSIFELR